MYKLKGYTYICRHRQEVATMTDTEVELLEIKETLNLCDEH